jgi:catechol 2,3-dioxygenase-like lactoylglutathione lyase family enzyme
MTITGVANLAVKVQDLDDAVAFYRRSGANVTDPEEWQGGRRADVQLGALSLTLFTRAIYEDDVDLPDDGFLHVALFSDNLEREVEGHRVVWGPSVVSGPTFGTRRIVFVDAPGGMRLEFMEQLADPA